MREFKLDGGAIQIWAFYWISDVFGAQLLSEAGRRPKSEMGGWDPTKQRKEAESWFTFRDSGKKQDDLGSNLTNIELLSPCSAMFFFNFMPPTKRMGARLLARSRKIGVRTFFYQIVFFINFYPCLHALNYIKPQFPFLPMLVLFSSVYLHI